MKLKKTIILTGILSFPLLFGEFTYKKSAGAHPGSTAAPLDNTCAKSGCHVGTPITLNDTSVNQLIFSSPDSTYVPGQTYTITVRTNNPGVQRFGFELQPIKDLTSTEIGTLVITDNIRTQALTHTVAGQSRTSATHRLAGTAELSPGFNEWTFDWIAPPVNEGVITFYYATNSTNNNNASSGDAIFNNSFKIRPFSGLSISEFVDEESVNVFYDQESNQVTLNYLLKKDKKVGLKVYDNLAREVAKPMNIRRSKGQHKEQMELKSDLGKGVYYVTLTIDDRSVSKKIIIN
ncbi:MAG: T9SS type A sorting domain-containing protein [Bacteroidota bacterium]|nr:T9SS type A sorting domain-containing protein [Bacteroidota bacterium]